MNTKPLRTLQTVLGLSGAEVDGKLGPATRARIITTLQSVHRQCWETGGWVSLGRTRNYDWIHVQAARI